MKKVSQHRKIKRNFEILKKMRKSNFFFSLAFIFLH